MCRNADCRNARGQNIFYHHGASPDPNVVRDADATDDLGILPDVNVVADDGGVIRIAAIAADAAVAMDDAAFADTRLGVHDYRSKMLQMEVLTEAAGADDETQAGTEAVLAPAVPEAEQLVRAGEGVLLLGPEESQIPLDVVHLRTDPPLEYYFFRCHKLLIESFAIII